MVVRGVASCSAAIFSTLGGNISYPAALLGLIPLSAARTSCRFNFLNLNVLGVCFALMANALL